MFHIQKVYADGSSARHYTCASRASAEAYLNFFAIEAQAKGEFVSSDAESVTIAREGKQFVYRIDEVI